MNRRKLILATIVLVVVLVLSGVVALRQSQALGGLLPFGGRIMMAVPCCNGYKVIVGPPRPGIFLFTAGSRLYAHYNIFTPGAWTLGTARPGGICLETAAACLVSTPVTGIIDQVGTSGL